MRRAILVSGNSERLILKSYSVSVIREYNILYYHLPGTMSGGIRKDIQDTTTNKPVIHNWRMKISLSWYTWRQVVGDDVGREVPLQGLQMQSFLFRETTSLSIGLCIWVK